MLATLCDRHMKAKQLILCSDYWKVNSQHHFTQVAYAKLCHWKWHVGTANHNYTVIENCTLSYFTRLITYQICHFKSIKVMGKFHLDIAIQLWRLIVGPLFKDITEILVVTIKHTEFHFPLISQWAERQEFIEIG